MYPNEILFGMSLYEILIVVGLFAGMLLFRRYSTEIGLSAKMHNLVIASAVITVIGGYLSGYLFQAVYDWIGGKPFRLGTETGSTFLGGFIGGFLILILSYFGIGHFLFPDREHIRRFPDALNGFAPCLALGHGFGRLGCLMAGCCYGKPAGWGIYFETCHCRAIPTQLFEALFLFALCPVLYRLAKKKLAVAGYFIGYGVWRFLIEFLRGDDRGKTVVDFLSPSQLVSVLLVIAGAILLLIQLKKEEKTE